jgi:hypothetical protein
MCDNLKDRVLNLQSNEEQLQVVELEKPHDLKLGLGHWQNTCLASTGSWKFKPQYRQNEIQQKPWVLGRVLRKP